MSFQLLPLSVFTVLLFSTLQSFGAWQSSYNDPRFGKKLTITCGLELNQAGESLCEMHFLTTKKPLSSIELNEMFKILFCKESDLVLSEISFYSGFVEQKENGSMTFSPAQTVKGKFCPGLPNL